MIERRKTYIAKQDEMDASKLIFVDESGVIKGMSRLYGWSPIGEQAVITRRTKGKRLSFVGAMAMDGSRGMMTYTGTMNTARMLEYVEHHLVPNLREGDQVVMDGLNIHKNVEVRALIEKAGAEVIILPPYSPELNPIEHLWSTLKARMRAIGCDEWSELPELVERIWAELPLSFYRNWVKNCGYPVPSA